MTPLDSVLAAAGLTATAIERRGGSRRVLWAVIIALFALSAVPSFLIGSSQRPTDLTFDDVRLNRIPAMTSWVRVTGDLELTDTGAIYFYRLHDPDNERHYIVVTSRAPLETGRVFVTGRVTAGSSTSDNVGSIDEADVPPIPKRNEPFGLILLPAGLGTALIIGRRVGYPAIRRERPSRDATPGLAQGARVPARWSGRIGNEVVAHAAAEPCTLAVRSDPDLSHLSIVDARAERTVSIRRHTPPVWRIRACYVRHSEPGLEIHSQSSDLVVVLDDSATRDRLLTTLT